MTDATLALTSRRAAMVAVCCLGMALGVAIAITRAADSPVTDWPSYNRTLTSERYVPFDQINKTNVARLKQLCVYDLDVDTSFQTGPLVIDRTLYATTDKEILAIDADTCQLKWRVREDGPSLALRVNRGAAYLDGRLFRGTEKATCSRTTPPPARNCGPRLSRIRRAPKVCPPHPSRGTDWSSSGPQAATGTA